MQAALEAPLTFEGREIEIRPDYFSGAVDTAKLTLAGAALCGWAVRYRPQQEALPPQLFLVVLNGIVVKALAPNHNRSDIANKLGEALRLSGFNIELKLEEIPKPFLPDFEIYAYDGAGVATRLSRLPQTDFLTPVRFKTGGEFLHLIQSPSTRLNQPEILAFTSLHALKLFPGNYAIGCASLCVIGYRLLDKEIHIPEVQRIFDEQVAAFIQLVPADVSFGLYLRWHTSLRLVLGYLAYQNNDLAAAKIHFEKMTEFVSQLATWPTALTNILLAIYLSGYLSLESGDTEEALRTWERAPDILRHGASIVQFQNFYAYGELGNAVRVAQECYVALTSTKLGGEINNPNLAPVGRKLELKHVPGPISRLNAERQKLAAGG